MQQSYNSDHSFKTAILGNAKVGKTNLLLCFASYPYTGAKRSSTGANFTLNLNNGKTVNLNTRDLTTVAHLASLHGVILAYDITNAESFKDIQQWYEKAETHNAYGTPRFILVGCKADEPGTKRQVTTEQAAAYAKKLGIPFFETSAKTGVNVENVFMVLAEQMQLFQSLSIISEQLKYTIRSIPSDSSPSLLTANKKEIEKTFQNFEKEIKAVQSPSDKNCALRSLDIPFFEAIEKDLLKSSLLIRFTKENMQRWMREALGLIKQIMNPPGGNPGPGSLLTANEKVKLSDLKKNLQTLQKKIPATEDLLHKNLGSILQSMETNSSMAGERHPSGIQAAASRVPAIPLDRKIPASPIHSPVSFLLPSFVHGPAPYPLASSFMREMKQAAVAPAPQSWITTYHEADRLLEQLIVGPTPETRQKLIAMRSRLTALLEEPQVAHAKAMMSLQINKINRELGSGPSSHVTQSTSSASLSSSLSSSSSSSVSSSSASSDSSSASGAPSAPVSVSTSTSSFFLSTSSAATSSAAEEMESGIGPYDCPISLEIMKEPVMPLLLDKDGQPVLSGDSFDKENLLKWCKGKAAPRCPLTNQLIVIQNGQPVLFPNKGLKEAMDAHQKGQKQEKDSQVVPEK